MVKNWPPQVVIDDLKAIIDGTRGPSSEPSGRMGDADEIRRCITEKLELVDVPPRQYGVLVEEILRDVWVTYNDTSEVRAAAELLGFEVVKPEEIANALERKTPAWLTEGNIKSGRKSKTFRFYMALLARGERLTTKRDAQDKQYNSWIPDMAAALLSYLDEYADRAMQIAVEHGFRSIRDTGSVASQLVGTPTGDQEVPLPNPCEFTASNITLPVVDGRQRPPIIIGDYLRESADFLKPTSAERLLELSSTGGISIIRGPRGAGKTQLAGWYMRHCRDEKWELIAWVNAESREELLSGLDRVAGRLGVADASHDSLASARNLRELLDGRDLPALLVLDNATDADNVRTLLPGYGATRVLITTTNAAFDRIGTVLKVEGFTEAEAVSYLSVGTGLTDEDGARAVADELGRLPLALAQASATIRGRHKTYPQYLELLRQVPVMNLLARSEGDDYPHSTAAAILLSVESVEAADDSGLRGKVLRLVALLGSPGVRRDLLYAGLAAHDELSRSPIDDAIERCVSGSLLDWSEDHSSVIMHRLVARVLRERMQADSNLVATVESALRLVDLSKVPKEEAWTKRTIGDELARHVETLSRRVPDWGGFDQAVRLRAGEVQAWAADQLRQTSDPLRAVQIGRVGLDNLRVTVGDSDPRVWDCYQTVGWSYVKVDQSSEGLPLLVQAVDLMSANLGPTAPATLNARKDLAVSYRDAGDNDEAARLLRELVREMSDAGQQDDPIAISARSNLAYILMRTSNYNDSIAAYREVLNARTRVLGPNHADTRKSRSNLASAFHAAGKSQEAIKLFGDLLRDNEQSLPADHSDTTLARENLGHVYVASGDIEPAIDMFNRALRDREQALDPSHPDLVRARISLAEAYESTGSFDLAAEQWQQVVSAREDSLGADSDDTRWAAGRLAAAQAELDRG